MDTRLPVFDSILLVRGETPIHDLDNYVIRFTFHSAWGWKKVWRIDVEDDSFVLNVKSFRDSYDPMLVDSLIDRYTRTLQSNEIDEVKALIRDSCFWTQPVWLPDRMFLDGATWTLEVNDPGGNPCTNETFHLVSASCPDADSLPLFYMGDRIIKLDSINARTKLTSW